MERDEVVLHVEPLIGLRLVFQTEVPADLLGRVERVDVSRLELAGLPSASLRTITDPHFLRFLDGGLFSVSFIDFPLLEPSYSSLLSIMPSTT